MSASIMASPDWHDLTTEKFRKYTFKDGVTYTVFRPTKLFVKGSGSHRVIAAKADGSIVSHYIPSGWIGISWEVHDGCDPFTF